LRKAIAHVPGRVVVGIRLCAAGERRAVMVKVPAAAIPVSARSQPARMPDRPRVAPVLSARERIESEHAALCAIESRLRGRGDPRFGCIRVLDFLPEERALISERAADPPLKQLLAAAHRLSAPRRGRRLFDALRSAGAWLRQYHQLPPLEHTFSRGASRESFADSLVRLQDYLLASGAPAPLAELALDLARRARVVLPAELPLGTCHGDLAPRNVLVGSEGRVTLLDTRAAWLAPIYEDLAYFGVSLRTAKVQLYSGGQFFRRAFLQELEAALLEGYFGAEPPPLPVLKLFRVQLLLDRWASLLHAERKPGIAAAARRAAAHRLLWRELRAEAA
jgi:hypothetical protein